MNVQTDQVISIEDKAIELQQLLKTLEASASFTAERDLVGTLCINLSSLKRRIDQTVAKLVKEYKLHGWNDEHGVPFIVTE